MGLRLVGSYPISSLFLCKQGSQAHAITRAPRESTTTDGHYSSAYLRLCTVRLQARSCDMRFAHFPELAPLHTVQYNKFPRKICVQQERSEQSRSKQSKQLLNFSNVQCRVFNDGVHVNVDYFRVFMSLFDETFRRCLRRWI